ncbi:Diacylglycerol pyrophosphate phosphatase 1 [Pseudocercospora fuligena]|uniref:Diacylglycerol pyrophosphate phosphatase 1 n=1 Tax=Pseudocercospora fuligena TaxID=685502 RepID=A0A8H6VK86_9PEZI|nr:Diacylglycerol pyrophosphate phosphatase 1 [Pseudocercospora fuligena]
MPTTANGDRERRKARSPPSSESGLYETLHRFWQRSSYAGDYFGLLVLVLAYTLVKITSEPFHSQFRLDDPRISHPHAEIERVPVVWLFVYAGIVPLALIVAWAALARPSLHKAHVTILGLIISILATTFLTDIFKDAIGRPRPDLIARCKPEASAPHDRLVTVDVCTETRHHVLHDGWRSYPSGHSSFAFSGLGWLALLLASQTHLLRPRASFGVVLICMIPLLGACLIAISRLEDYRHDVFDVVSGSLLGFLVALLNWRRYYPSLLEDGCDEPYSTTSSGRNSPVGYQRARDEEEGHANDRFNAVDDR